jgi:hypothetical protein
MRSDAWAVWAPCFTFVVCWRRQHFVSYTGGCPSPRGRRQVWSDPASLHPPCAGRRNPCRFLVGGAVHAKPRQAVAGADRIPSGHSTGRAFLVSLISTHPPDGTLSRTSLRPRPRSQRSSASIASSYHDQCARARNISSFVAVRRIMSYSCRRAASGSIRDARLAGA